MSDAVLSATDKNDCNKSPLIVFRQLPKGDMRFERDLSIRQSGEYVTASEYGRCLTASVCSLNSTCYAHRFITPKLLIIDEAEYLEEKTETQGNLHSILCQRVADGKTTIIISTGSIEDIYGVIGDDLAGYLAI